MIYCIMMIDQRLPTQICGKCFFGEENKDSIKVSYRMGHLTFVDSRGEFGRFLMTNDSSHVRLCFDVERLIGRGRIVTRRYRIGFYASNFKEFFKYPDELLLFNIITLNKKKDQYLFYFEWGSMCSKIKEKKGKKIHWKTFVYSGTYF